MNEVLFTVIVCRTLSSRFWSILSCVGELVETSCILADARVEFSSPLKVTFSFTSGDSLSVITRSGWVVAFAALKVSEDGKLDAVVIVSVSFMALALIVGSIITEIRRVEEMQIKPNNFFLDILCMSFIWSLEIERQFFN